jgi:hypothetical protein
VFLQVPNAVRILRDIALEDIYYEHCSYFSPGSLARACEQAGLTPTRLETTYGEQYTALEAVPKGAVSAVQYEDDRPLLSRLVRHFPERAEAWRRHWRRHLTAVRNEGRRVVLWGGSSKSVAFLTTCKVAGAIHYVVDINPHRQGHFLPGTGQPIVPPVFLRAYRPDAVLLMNRIYMAEVRETLRGLKVDTELLAL